MSQPSASDLYRTDPDLVDDIIDIETGRDTRPVYEPDADVAELARMIHSVVFVSDLHGGLLTPATAGRYLRGALRSLTDEDVAQAVGAAAMFRGRSFDARRAFVPPF